MKKNRTCICCKTQYSYCPNCSGSDSLKSFWYEGFCSKECKDIFQTCTDYNFKLITKEQAKEALSKCDLSNRSKFSACVQRDLNTILAESKPATDEQFKKKEATKNSPDMK